MRGFRFRSILYSERCAHICLAPSQNWNVWRPNIHVWTHFVLIFSLRVHGWIQTTVLQLAGVRGCRRKRRLSFLYSLHCRRFLWARNLLAKSPCWNFPKRGGNGASQGLLFLLSPNFHCHQIKDGGYNNINTNTNKVSPIQNTHALQAIFVQCFYTWCSEELN